MMNKKTLMAEIKKRSWRGFYIALIYGFLMGLANTFSGFKKPCNYSNPLRAFQCPSEWTQIAFGTLGGLIDLIIIGLPFGYLFYNDIKWKLLGYKSAAKGVVTNILWVAICVDAFFSFYIEIPAWVGVTLFILLYLWFIISMTYYHALKKQYEDDKNHGKVPKLGIIEVLKKERMIDEQIAESNKVSQAKGGTKADDTFDDGL